MEKEYGKLSAEHLRQLMQFADKLDKEREELPAVLRTKPGKWETVVDNVIPWCPYYDKPMLDQVMGFLYAFGLMHEVRAAAKSDDPHQTMIDAVTRNDTDEALSPEMGDAVLKNYGLLIGLVNSFDSLRIFGKYLNELVAEGQQGSDKAFFDAIRIDPTVMGTNAFIDRLSRAVVEGKPEFFEDLRKALRGKTKKHQDHLHQVRLAIRALIETGGMEMSDDKLYELFVEKLDLYRATKTGDPVKAIRKHIRKQKNHSTTQKR